MYPISVSGKRITKLQKKHLKKNGLEWDGLNYVGYINSDRAVNKLRNYCDRHKLRLKINNSLGTRSSDYRRIFFIYNKPMIGEKYICAYCGRLLKKDKVTVDHLYPVGRASKNLKYQKKLERNGIKNINQPSNLVPACSKCNRMKSSKTGLWIIRGKIGRYKYLWYLRWGMRVTVVITVIFLLWFYDGGKYINNMFSYIEDLYKMFL